MQSVEIAKAEFNKDIYDDLKKFVWVCPFGGFITLLDIDTSKQQVGFSGGVSIYYIDKSVQLWKVL